MLPVRECVVVDYLQMCVWFSSVLTSCEQSLFSDLCLILFAVASCSLLDCFMHVS
jgi:hypothetical protein